MSQGSRTPASSDKSWWKRCQGCQICRFQTFHDALALLAAQDSAGTISSPLSLCDRVYYTSPSTFPSLYLFYYNADISVAMVTNCRVTFFSFFACTESGFFFCRPPLCEGTLWSRLLWATSGPHGDKRCGLQWGHQEALMSASSVDIRCV